MGGIQEYATYQKPPSDFRIFIHKNFPKHYTT